MRQTFGLVRPGVPVHISRQCVADAKPDTGRYRMLYRTSLGQYRLFGSADPCHRDWEDGRVTSKLEEMLMEFRGLLPWYEEEYRVQPLVLTLSHPLLKHLGVGDSGLGDLSVNHGRYLAEDVYKESHPDQPT